MTLDTAIPYLYAHDVTTLFAGLALRARRAFGLSLTRLHADTTSFAVSGDHQPVEGDLDAQTIAVTYGYSRDHREDLKQWMLALVTSDEGIPHFLEAAGRQCQWQGGVTRSGPRARPPIAHQRGDARDVRRRQRALQ